MRPNCLSLRWACDPPVQQSADMNPRPSLHRACWELRGQLSNLSKAVCQRPELSARSVSWPDPRFRRHELVHNFVLPLGRDHSVRLQPQRRLRDRTAVQRKNEPSTAKRHKQYSNSIAKLNLGSSRFWLWRHRRRRAVPGFAAIGFAHACPIFEGAVDVC
jgi:hypothetical protein